MKIRPGQPGWSEVDLHLDRMLDVPEAEWESYLSGLGSEQADVAEALREMLADRSHLHAGGFIEAGVVGPPDEEFIGAQLGAYTINSLLGRGGMGQVWLAQRSDGRFEGKFAIKFLDSYAAASSMVIDRFRREGRLLARLAHPHIARLIDAGVSPSGRPYLVLEYVRGERIDVYCESRLLGIEARIHLLLDILGALAHAHSNLVVHRDIKPSNILVTSDGKAKLLDFGVAKLLSAEGGDEDQSPPTRLEDSAFTPEFAAPEQILGEPASTATDVYQVGVLLFALLAGRLPLAVTGTTRSERVRSALDAEPPRLSDVAPSALRHALRGDLDAIVSKALRRLPQERYGTAAALSDDLKRYLENEPVTARANLLGYRIRKFVRRYKAAVVGTSVAMAALVAATGFALFQMHEARIQRDQSRDQARRAELQSEFVTLMMSTVGTKPTTAEQLLDAGVRLLGEHYTADPNFRASALINLSYRYSDLGLTQKQAAVLQTAADIARRLDDPSLVARSDCAQAGVEIDLGHIDRAAAQVAAGRAALSRVANANPLYVEDCMEAEADLAGMQNRPADSIKIGEQALALLERAGETHDMRYSGLLGRIADYYKSIGDSHRGFEYVERALRADEQEGLGDTDWAMLALHNVASGLMGFGEVTQSCSREKDLIERLQSTGRAVIPAMSVLYGTCMLKSGNPAEALHWYDIGVSTSQAENDVPLQMHSRTNRARALIALNRLAEAGSDLDQVAALGKEGALSESITATRAQIVRAELLLAQGQDADARRAIEVAVLAARDPSRRLLLSSALLCRQSGHRTGALRRSGQFGRAGVEGKPTPFS